MQEDDKLSALSTAARNHEDLVQLTADKLAVEGEMDDVRAARGPIPAPPVPYPDPACAGNKHDQRYG